MRWDADRLNTIDLWPPLGNELLQTRDRDHKASFGRIHIPHYASPQVPDIRHHGIRSQLRHSFKRYP